MVGPGISTVKRRLGGTRALVWAGLLAALALVLDLVPLFDLLGYDFAFAIGLLAMLAGVDVGHGTVAGARRDGQPIDPLPLAATAAARGLALLGAPLAFSLANALRVRNCNLGAGLAFYALLPVATMLYAAPAGVLAGLAFPRRGRLCALLLPAGSMVWTLCRMYLDPPVFAFDPFGGYFPGPIYDEALRPPARLLHFRLASVLWVGAPLAFAHAIRRRTLGARVAAALLAGAAATVYLQRGALGFHLDGRGLARILDGEIRSTHFILRHPHDDGRSAADRQLDLRDLEFRYDQLRRILGVEPRGPVTVWQFAGTGQKKDLVGAANTLYAKPWTREIFVQADRFPGGRLRHELAHVFAAAFGDPIFGVSLAWRLPLPRLATGLIEGVAEAADFADPGGSTTLHQDARAIVADGRAPPLAALVGAGFTAVAGARAYTLAGSFCRYLLDTEGAGKLRAVFRSGGDFEGVYGRSLDALETRWKAFLDTQPLPPRDRAAAKERFRRPAIFKKVCARELAARVAEARGLLRSDAGRAVRLLEATCRDDGGEPTYKIDLAEALVAAGRQEPALALLGAIGKDETATMPLRLRAANLASGIAYHRGDFTRAADEIRRVASDSNDEGERRAAAVKLRALARPDERPTLGRALYGDGPTGGSDPVLVFERVSEFARSHPDDGLGAYLVGRQLAGRDAALALPRLERACPLDGDGAGTEQPDGADLVRRGDFVRECLRLTGETAFRAGDLRRARAAYGRLRDAAANEAEKLRALDWLERIDWEEASRASARPRPREAVR